jgi:hypothetical protein
MNARLTAVLTLAGCFAAACSTQQQQLPLGQVPGTNAITPATSSSNDAWTTFAYDYKHTGLNPAVTTITAANVRKLKLRWKVNIPSTKIAASPVVYAGNMIITTYGAKVGGPTATVYDVSTADGHTIWKYNMGDNAKMTPSIDPDAGLVIVGNEEMVKRRTDPSHLYALRLLDGKLMWRVSSLGIFRSTPLVTGGTVYAGLAGGDPPICAQGGIFSINESTGTINWTWAVDPTPHEGGSVWGAIAYDGTHPIFGTGNTCQTPVMTSNGAVSLNADGTPNWDMVAVKNSDADSDTGGGVMLYKDRAYFINKNGIFYAVGEANGKILWSKTLNPYAKSPTWNGGFATPSTDGHTIVIGTGLYSGSTSGAGGDFCFIDSAPDEVIAGYHSELQGLDFRGDVLWTRTMQNRLIGYVAMVKGIGFVGLNEEFVAIDLSDGKTLWHYATPTYIDASMVIVPSGVYGADDDGNVYAFAIPTTKR